ncbi:MAG: pseudouridine-5'-phosphate glycosidase, partial [Anaerolineaceae bacterium]
MKRIPSYFEMTRTVSEALRTGAPLVALESTVITHGLPRPQNLELAQSMEAEVGGLNAVPATVALMDGKIKVGLEPADMQRLASAQTVHKISTRDMGAALVNRWTGGTTVAATMFCAHHVGIKIFATGGIGGVHRGNGFDVSADLTALSEIPIVVVCSGAKAILDLPATREKLETLGIPVIGFQTGDFPAFYSTSSGLAVDFVAD